MTSKLSSPFMANLRLVVCGSGKGVRTLSPKRVVSSFVLMAREDQRVLQCVHAAVDVGPGVQYGNQEGKGAVGYVLRRAQHGLDATIQQLTIEAPRVDARDGPQRLDRKQAAQCRQADLTQVLPEAPHDFHKASAQEVASLRIEGECVLGSADCRQ